MMIQKNRTLTYITVVLASVLLTFPYFKQLLIFSFEHKFSSHVPLIPLLSAGLIIYKRGHIFSRIRGAYLWGGMTAVFGAVLFACLSWWNFGLDVSDVLSFKTLAVVVFWQGTFLFLFGAECFRKAVFPLLFLLFMVPIPEVLLNAVVAALQQGTAEMTEFLFKITGTPYFRDNLVFALPRINIEIAGQCSGIRSSLALLISALLAAHLILKTVWRKWIFVLFIVPIAMFKNAVRIAVLSLLSIHIDQRFLLNSGLHQEGGILFYLLALLLLLPVLSLLRRSERKADVHKADPLKVT